jgi:hypothetical protein
VARRGEEDFMVSTQAAPATTPAAERSICTAACFLQSRAPAVTSGGNDDKCCPACAGAVTASSATKVACFVMVDEMDRKLAAKEEELGTRGV